VTSARIATRLITLAAVALLTMAADLVPDDQQAPGAINAAVTQANIAETICARGWSERVRPPLSFTEPIKRRLLGAGADQFELDHRVPIEVGGCPDCVSNLWLQPWRDPRHHACNPDVMLDAACKDELENAVRRRICSGRMTLAQGQAIFLGDWTAGFAALRQGDD